ncbi:hypothetical protein PAXRUDRAFT_830411 [Paxillus rubicundulus Ve08.2h10]|uniref:Unplaced genomic scaffold scaffold_508, whole genome shotgun sequence n=1 Tax=Paxillus rubicundulus Ve08.2h10 TaxID=930991 RepID=A0A0D0DL48_9AGAM|nr:hypothetical protein PAXRUDRAFT_830411 [Paxillus rubicundulus Ve08.2h10]
MLGIEDYGSDIESGDESLSQTSTKTSSRPTTSSLASKLPPPKSKSTFSLPPPKSSSSSSLSLPTPSNSASVPDTTAAGPATVKQKRTKKITINLPSLPQPEEGEEDRPPAKKPRITPSTGEINGGAGGSSLFGMLPAPKQLVPVIEKKEVRVLGGGGGPGLVFRASRSETRTEGVVEVADAGTSTSAAEGGAEGVLADETASGNAPRPSTSFLPPSLKKGRTNISLESEGLSKRPSLAHEPPRTSAAPVVDFFSLGSGTTPAVATVSPSTSSTLTSAPSALTSISATSAPSIPTFRPPSPTLNDPYPGYYQLPSGAYVPFDSEYYASYAHKWKVDYDKQIRALEKSQYAPEGAQDVDMASEMEKARREIKEREEKKALTAGKAGKQEDGEPAMPKMNVRGAKLGAVARSRHQLTTLLTEAYMNREALEERIAQGRRNRKEAGNKYGF